MWYSRSLKHAGRLTVWNKVEIPMNDEAEEIARAEGSVPVFGEVAAEHDIKDDSTHHEKL